MRVFERLVKFTFALLWYRSATSSFGDYKPKRGIHSQGFPGFCYSCKLVMLNIFRLCLSVCASLTLHSEPFTHINENGVKLAFYEAVVTMKILMHILL